MPIVRIEEELEIISDIINGSPNIVFTMEKDKIISVNNRFFEFFKELDFNTFLLSFKAYSDLKPYPEKINSLLCLYNFFDSESSNKFTMEASYKNQSILYEVIGYKIRSTRIVILLQDITKFKRIEKAILKQAKMDSLGEMLHNIAHHWRQPLSTISSLSTGIVAQSELGMLNDEKLYKSLEKITEATQKMSSIIEDFNRFHLSNKSRELFNMTNMFNKIIRLLPRNTKNLIKIVSEIEDLNYYGYENELVQVILIMIENAKEILCDRALNDKIVYVTVKRDHQSILISIHDSGNGIPEELKDKVFEPYFTTKHQKQGVGVGLYMSHELISFYMDGYIKVNNEDFKYNNKTFFGAKFTIVLPLK